MRDNLVEIIGYQEEKVHTGILGWLLDSRTSPDPDALQAALLGSLFGVLRVPGGRVEAEREYSFGRSHRIDLVLTLGSGETDTPEDFVVVECKTDSDLSLAQLKRSQDRFEQEHGESTVTYVALLLGAGQFTARGREEKVNELGWRIVDLRDVVRTVGQLPDTHLATPGQCWKAALERELDRQMKLPTYLTESSGMWDPKLKEVGYRLGFPLFYNYYDHLRSHIQAGDESAWIIFSGGNNPVMNFKPSLTSFEVEGITVSTYYEVNYDTLRIKASLPEGPPPSWKAVRRAIQNSATEAGLGGKKTANRPGTYVSIYKWQYNFAEQPVFEVAAHVDEILARTLEPVRKCVAPFEDSRT